MIWLIFFLLCTPTYPMQEMFVSKQKNNKISYPNWRNTIATVSSCTQKALITLLPIAYASNNTYNSTESIEPTSPDLTGYIIPWIPTCIGTVFLTSVITYMRIKNKNPTNVSTAPLVDIKIALQNLSGIQDLQNRYQFNIRYAEGFPRIWANQEAIPSKTLSLCLQEQFPHLPKDQAQHIFYFINTIEHEMNWYLAFGTYIPHAERTGKNPFIFIKPTSFYWAPIHNKTIELEDQNLVAINIK